MLVAENYIYSNIWRKLQCYALQNNHIEATLFNGDTYKLQSITCDSVRQGSRQFHHIFINSFILSKWLILIVAVLNRK